MSKSAAVATCPGMHANILEAGIDWRTLAMSEDDLHLLQLKISRVQLGELGLAVRFSRSERSHAGLECVVIVVREQINEVAREASS